MKRTFAFGFAAILAIAIAGCGGSSGGATTSEDTLAAANISQLPKATSPMASSSASISSAPKSVLKSAETGLPLLAASSSSFQQGDSMAACQVANVLKESVISAAQADQILCYVQAMSDTFGEAVTDPYDGEWHIYNLDITGESGDDQSPSKVKMRIVKNTAGNITSFVMHMCNATTQTGYVSQTLDGASLTMAARGTHSSSEWSGGYQVDVTGTLNTSGAYTQRTITMRNAGSSGASNSNWQEATVTQTPGAFIASGYQRGEWTNGDDNGTYAEAAYATGELLNDTSTDITTLAVGDGAVNADADYTFVSSEFSGSFDPDAEVFAWLGDSMEALEPASDSSFYPAASAGTIPPLADSFSITFDADQEWDCTDDVVAAVTLPAVSGPEIDAACNQYDQSHSWIDCYQAIGQFENQEQE